MISKSYLPFGWIADFGKKSVVGTPSNLGLILEDITNIAEVQIVSINHRLLPTWDTCKIHGTIILPYRGFAIIGG